MPARSSTLEKNIHPQSAASTPIEFRATARSSQDVRGARSPRKIGIHLALKPQTKGTRNPQVSSERNLWSKLCGRIGEFPCQARYNALSRFIRRAANQPIEPAITTKIHS